MLNSQDLGLVLVALIGLVGTLFGTKRGRDALTKSPDKAEGGDVVEIRGAIVSDRAVEKLVQSFDALTSAVNRDVEAKGKLTVALHDSGRRLDRNSDVSQEMRDDIRDVSGKLERLKDELIRSGVKGHD